jgi:hypothetical protein
MNIKLKGVQMKNTIFISYSSEDSFISLSLQEYLEGVLPSATIYVSENCIESGKLWPESIKSNLHKASAIIVLITQYSKNSKWVYFEAGAGFIAEKSIPLCADQMEVSKLEPPLSFLQARNFLKEDLKTLTNELAVKIDQRIPKTYVGLDKLLEDIYHFCELRKNEKGKDKGFDDNDVNRLVEAVMDADKIKKYNKQKKLDPLYIEYKKLVDKFYQIALHELTLLGENNAIYDKDGSFIPFIQLLEILRCFDINIEGEYLLTTLSLELDFPLKGDFTEWKKKNIRKTINKLKIFFNL